jgi:hypothetical protein
VLALTFVAAVLAVIFISPVYRTQVSFVANVTGGSRLPASALSAAGPLAGLATQLGVSAGADPSESPNFYIELTQSRELLTRLLQSRFRDPRGASPADSAPLIETYACAAPIPSAGSKKESRRCRNRSTDPSTI